jgi:predicted DNA-binding transcriptional regulator AlpA
MTRPEITGKKIQRFYSKRQLADRYNTCTRSIDRWVKAGRFPQPIRLPNGHHAWADTVIEAHERSFVGGPPPKNPGLKLGPPAARAARTEADAA